MSLAMSCYGSSGSKWLTGPRINVHVTRDGAEVLDGQSGHSSSESKQGVSLEKDERDQLIVGEPVFDETN